MLVTVLSVPDCPSVAMLLDRLDVALAGRPVNLNVVVIDDGEPARRWGMTGSPTLLVNGLDPFAPDGIQASVSCRLYRDVDGVASGAPSVAELRTALAATARQFPGRAGRGWIDVAGRGGRGRLAPVERGLRAMQRALLRGMADSGSVPDARVLEGVAEPFGLRGADVIGELAALDFVTVDHTGGLRAIYPFSVPASAHRVRVEDGPQVWAMCAIDALGIAPMLGRSVAIDTVDPITGNSIGIRVRSTGTVQAPPGSVVFLGRREAAGPAEKVCCDAINAFDSRHSAARWAARRPEVFGEALDMDEAAQLGRAIFGGLLAGE